MNSLPFASNVKLTFLFFVLIGWMSSCQSSSSAARTGRDIGPSVTIKGSLPTISSPIQVHQGWGGPITEKISLTKDGQFSVSIPVGKATLAYLTYGNQQFPLLLEPNQTITLAQGKDQSIVVDNPTNETYSYVVQEFRKDLKGRMGRFLRWTPAESSKLVKDFLGGYLTYLESRKDVLSPPAYELIEFDLERLEQEFLYNFGRMNWRIAGDHPVYNFVDAIDETDEKYVDNHTGLPVIIKYKVLFERSGRTLGSPTDFIDYLGQEFTDKNFRAYYQSFYLQLLLEKFPLLMEDANKFEVSDATSIDQQLGESNPYRFLYADALDRYYEAEGGTKAVDFTALNREGIEVNLSDFAGKVIYIDAWASWCGPCKAELPYLYEVARDYEDNPDFVILTISFDYGYQKWQTALAKQEVRSNIIPLYVPEGVNSTFAQSYFVSSIPDYKLINRERGVVSLEAPHPSNKRKLKSLINETLAER